MAFHLDPDLGHVLPIQHQYQLAWNQEPAPKFELSPQRAENYWTSKLLQLHHGL
jgi:hypothetical protein